MWKNKTNNRKKELKMKKILSSCIVLCMVFTAIATITPSIVADEGMNGSEPTLRIYGEKDAVYPTHSYYGAKDFIYPDEDDPFDPGIIEKDSITFNAAFWYGHDEYEIQARGDASEKIFLRAFYEPGYTHEIDNKMSGCGVLLDDVEQFDAIVTETTYFLTTLNDRLPNYGYGGETRIALPYQSADPVIPGMEKAGLLDVARVYSCGGNNQLTDGAIEVEKIHEFDNIDYTQDLTIRFMDHMVIIKNFENNDPENDRLNIQVFYIGNMNDRIPVKRSHDIWENSMGPDPSNNYYFDRQNHKQTSTDPCHRWYIRIESADEDYLRIATGRRLVAGETFYVDGVRYDMPAIYTQNIRAEGECGFKYITFQTPIPKGCPIWQSDLELNVNDFSHVTSQYLASLPMDETAWLLPPFNEAHTMIDDIALEKPNPHCKWNCLHPPGKLLDGKKDALDIRYIDETIEERFESSLLERLNTDEEENEDWYWYNVYTKPNRYTEFLLPDQETPNENYPNSGAKADGYEYIITTSLIAPNSEVDTDPSDRCKDYYEHEIFDTVYDIALDDERAMYYKEPRFVFEYDAYNEIDFFINEKNPRPSVRIYGEENFVYPTQSFTGAEDFIYDEESDPFDPGVIKKDSITFNPAFIDGEGGVYEIEAQGDASEKIFLRAFYEPEYTHPIDTLMDDCSDVLLKPVEQFDAIVTETTYFLVTLDRDPTVGYPRPQLTKVFLPYKSSDPTNPGMEEGGLLEVRETRNAGTMQLTDGVITVEKEYEFFDDTYEGESIYFMDHKVQIVNFEDNDPDEDKLDLKISYIGNMDEAISSTRTITVPESEWGHSRLWFDRDNRFQFNTDPCHRWYMYIENADDNYLRVQLGRALAAGETFYVDGVRYDMPAVYVDGDGGFKYITLQSPIPKGYPIWEYPLNRNVDDFSHVTSQYLASLPENVDAWLLPPFNEMHTMIDDIGLYKSTPHSGEECLDIPGKIIKDERNPLSVYYIDEDVEERFESSLVERLNTTKQDENWYWYNVYTKPNRYTEFILSDDETTMDYYESGGHADGNEYLITSSLIAPNSELDTDRSDKCKNYDEHEIFSSMNEGSNGNSGSAQFCMIIDGSGSIDTGEWNLMITGIADAVRNNMPHDGSVEFTVIQFADNIVNDAQVEVGPVKVSKANFENIATQVENIVQMFEFTPLAAGINLATTTLDQTNHLYDRQIINIVTDGLPNVPGGQASAKTAAVNAINNMVSTLGFDSGEDEIDAEGIGITASNLEWLRSSIVWPQPGYDTWPPVGPGWVRAVKDFEEFSDSIAEKFDILFERFAPRFAYEFDACDGTGLYINDHESPEPPTQDPTADAGGNSEGYSGNCVDPVTFDGSGSHDNDEGGDTITHYRWDWTNDGSYDTGWSTSPIATHTYTAEGTYTVKLQVKDNEGEMDTDTASVSITCGEDPGPGPETAYVIMDDVDIDCEGGVSYAYIHATNIVEHVGSCSITLGFDLSEVTIVSIDNYEFDSMFFSVIDDELYLTGVMNSGYYLTGDFNIARIGFEKVGTTGCDLEIKYSELLTDESSPSQIAHNTMDGYADINCNNPSVLGDMNGDGIFNSGDVRCLAIYYASNGNDPEYSPLHADGDVNNDGSLNSGDVRYLAIYYASNGNDPEYSPLYP